MNQRGFTIVEIILVSFITTTVIMILVRFISTGFPVSKVSYLTANSTQTARIQLHRLAVTLRELRYSDEGAYPIDDASPQRLVFYANVDSDVLVERVRYELVGTNFVRGIIKPTGTPLTYNTAQETTTTIASYIVNGATPIFTYYNGNYPTDTTSLNNNSLLNIKYIDFNLSIDVSTTQPPPATPVHSQVQLRNLKTNLGS